ncbi:hypothetical protein F4819DRAFT_488143 [Hypoxylon fuscum]|nr:hypothetical protein F4819DRAFT_488143 [Hypoxylon fuscum]
MQYKQLIAAFAVTAWSAISTVAMEHGEYAEHNGLLVRYHQLAPGVFSGIRAEDWNDAIHQRSDEELDFNTIKTRDIDLGNNETLAELVDRNLEAQCQLVYNCVKKTGSAAISKGWEIWLKTAEVSAERAKKVGLVDFLKSPFFANAGGVAIAGIIAAHVNGQANPASCSTSDTDADLVASAISAAVASNPTANVVSVDINGPRGSWNIVVSAAPAGQTPKTTC